VLRAPLKVTPSEFSQAYGLQFQENHKDMTIQRYSLTVFPEPTDGRTD